MQTSQRAFPLDFHKMWCCVQHIRCTSHHGSPPSHTGHCQQGCDSKGGEATQGFNQRPVGISENRGNWQPQPWQESQAHLLQGQALWKAWNSLPGLLPTARLVFFHSSSHIPVFPPGCAVGRQLGGVSAACPAATARTIAREMGQEAPRWQSWLKGQSQVQSCATCSSKTGGHPPKHPS